MREVTEIDFRKDEFKDAKAEDYEFRADGAIVRKDRWENGIHKIKNRLFSGRREFEVDDIVLKVEELMIFKENNTNLDSDEHF